MKGFVGDEIMNVLKIVFFIILGFLPPWVGCLQTLVLGMHLYISRYSIRRDGFSAQCGQCCI